MRGLRVGIIAREEETQGKSDGELEEGGVTPCGTARTPFEYYQSRDLKRRVVLGCFIKVLFGLIQVQVVIPL